MKKYSLILFLLFYHVHPSYATDSTITITGYLKDRICYVSLDSQHFTVDLMTHATKQLHRVGAVTTAVPFKIVFDKCANLVTAVKVGYTGTVDPNNKTLLKINDSADAARGVGIQILDNDKKSIPLNASEGSLNWTTLVAGKPNTLVFYARLMATQSSVVAGTVNATTNFTLEFQ